MLASRAVHAWLVWMVTDVVPSVKSANTRPDFMAVVPVARSHTCTVSVFVPSVLSETSLASAVLMVVPERVVLAVSPAGSGSPSFTSAVRCPFWLIYQPAKMFDVSLPGAPGTPASGLMVIAPRVPVDVSLFCSVRSTFPRLSVVNLVPFTS